MLPLTVCRPNPLIYGLYSSVAFCCELLNLTCESLCEGKKTTATAGVITGIGLSNFSQGKMQLNVITESDFSKSFKPVY